MSHPPANDETQSVRPSLVRPEQIARLPSRVAQYDLDIIILAMIYLTPLNRVRQLADYYVKLFEAMH